MTGPVTSRSLLQVKFLTDTGRTGRGLRIGSRLALARAVDRDRRRLARAVDRDRVRPDLGQRKPGGSSGGRSRRLERGGGWGAAEGRELEGGSEGIGRAPARCPEIVGGRCAVAAAASISCIRAKVIPAWPGTRVSGSLRGVPE